MKEKLQAFWAKVNQDAKDIWNKDKGFFIAFGVLILFVKFRDLLIDLLLNSAKRVSDNAKKEDGKLANEESQANSQANDLIKKAQDLPNQQKPIDRDWYKKDGK